MRQLANPHHHILTPGQAADFAAVLHVLADPKRMLILSLLAHHGPLRNADLIPHLHLTQPAVSHHLGKLQKAGFVARAKATQDGIPYALVPEALDYVASFLRGA